MKFFLPVLLIAVLLIGGCGKKEAKQPTGGTMSSIDKATVDKVKKALLDSLGKQQTDRIEKGVTQAASFWTEKDGSAADFEKFCKTNFIANEQMLDTVFEKIQTNFEILMGHFNRVTLDLNRPLHLDLGELTPIDQMIGGYSVGSHLTDDFFNNKIAFYVILNFPFYTLQEKGQLGPNWTRKQWAYARMGDMFTSRIPAEYLLKISETQTDAETYISEYNIYAGHLIDEAGKTYFPSDMKLLSHWNLRDEIKSQYGKEDGLPKQKMIFQVMNRIITQEIPQMVINSDKYQWNPVTNKVFADGKEIASKPEPNTRYEKLLNNFKVNKTIDPFCPGYPDFIKRKFEQEYEIPQPEVEALFKSFVTSPVVKKVAALIQKRLGRNLEPFDLWYDGFKARSSYPEDDLTKITEKKYPNTEAFAKDMPNILEKMGFAPEKAMYIASKVEVDGARGSGHAWGADMKSEKAHLRTRIGPNGMNYKGYNIAVHEFGHNTEQTITLQDIDYYMLKGVPNTAFTEAWAFVFQGRDLELLGMKETNPQKQYLDDLDLFWSVYEIMGVSLVDMDVWKWMYANPNAKPEELKNAVITIAKDVWNKYYADVFGVKDQQILAIYSHMINDPLYLSAYPLGHLIQFQMEQNMKGKKVGEEMERILKQGRIIPQLWMKGAVGSPLSSEPMLKAAEEALNYVN